MQKLDLVNICVSEYLGCLWLHILRCIFSITLMFYCIEYYGSIQCQNAEDERLLLKLGGANIYEQLLKDWETFMDA